jgi:hypothetical protein
VFLDDPAEKYLILRILHTEVDHPLAQDLALCASTPRPIAIYQFTLYLFSVCFWIIRTKCTQHLLQFFEIRFGADLVFGIAGGIQSLCQSGDKLHV